MRACSSSDISAGGGPSSIAERSSCDDQLFQFMMNCFSTRYLPLGSHPGSLNSSSREVTVSPPRVQQTGTSTECSWALFTLCNVPLDVVLIVDVAAFRRRGLSRCPCLLIEALGRLPPSCGRRTIGRCRHNEPYCAIGDVFVLAPVHDGHVDRRRVSAPHGDPPAALLGQAEGVGVNNKAPHPRLGIEDVPRRRYDDQTPAPGPQPSHLQGSSQMPPVLVSVNPHTQLESAAEGVTRREARQRRRLVSPVHSGERRFRQCLDRQQVQLHHPPEPDKPSPVPVVGDRDPAKAPHRPSQLLGRGSLEWPCGPVTRLALRTQRLPPCEARPIGARLTRPTVPQPRQPPGDDAHDLITATWASVLNPQRLRSREGRRVLADVWLLPAELRRVAHEAGQELSRLRRERVTGVSCLPCEQFGAHTESGTQ